MNMLEQIGNNLDVIIHSYEYLPDIISNIDEHGGRSLLVGGAVRDLLLHKEVKDLDVEVHGLEADTFENILSQFGQISLVGKSFGVWRLHGLDIDWSLPRSDSAGRKPHVELDPFMAIEKAFERRDLTINAMGIDLITKELVDPFDGLHDLHNGILKTPNESFFVQDPLRFFRVMQFVGRFEMEPDEALNALCSSMNIAAVSSERIEGEFEKLLLKSKRPSLGIRWLHTIGRLSDILPELYATIGVKQNPKWHPEGDVFEHTMQALDAAAHIAQSYDNDHKKLVLLYAALCHDVGKPITTIVVDDVIKSPEHDVEGVPIARTMLKRITHKKDIIATVLLLVRYHMAPLQFISGDARLSRYKRLAEKLDPHATLQLLADLSLADRRGRNEKGGRPLLHDDPEITEFLHKAQQAFVLEKKEEPILSGKDIMDIVSPGPEMGRFLKYAYAIQIEEGMRDKKELKRRVILEFLKDKKKDT